MYIFMKTHIYSYTAPGAGIQTHKVVHASALSLNTYNIYVQS